METGKSLTRTIVQRISTTTMGEKMARDYKKEYRTYQGKPKQIKNRASRNKARATLMKAGRVKKGDRKDVDHKNGNPRDNRLKNLRVMSRSKNRAKKHNG